MGLTLSYNIKNQIEALIACCLSQCNRELWIRVLRYMSYVHYPSFFGDGGDMFEGVRLFFMVSLNG